MKAHIDKTRASLGELAGLAAKTDAAERRILENAEHRLFEVQRELDGIKGAEFGTQQQQEHYSDLIKERGQLHVVIAKAHEVLHNNNS